MLALTFTACQADEPTSLGMSDTDAELLAIIEDAGGLEGKEHFVLPQSHEFDKIPQDPNNPLNSVKVELGKKLFFETGLAINP